MQRLPFVGIIVLLSMLVGFAGSPARAQDRGGAAMAGGFAQAPPPPAGAAPPAGGMIPPGAMAPPAGAPIPPMGGGGGGFAPPMAGNLGVGTIPVLPPVPPIGYYAPRPVDYNMGKFFYYPYYYFPHSYWPTQTCKWPERPGEPYMRPPAYMSYPAFMEPHWRYEWYTPQRYYRGFHFWLDQF